MIPLPKKAGTQRCEEHRTLSMISHASKIMLQILKDRLESKIEAQLGQDQFGFRRGRGTRDAIGAMRLLSERFLEANKQLYVCFIDYEKAFDRVDWKKLLEIMKAVGIDWRDRRAIGNLYMNQTVTLECEVGNTKECEIGRGTRQGCNLSPSLFNLYSEMLIREALEGETEGVNIGGHLIQSIRYADDSSIVADSEEGLQKLMDRVVEVTKEYGMRINVNKTKVMKIARKRAGSLQISIEGKQLTEVESFKYLGSIINNNGDCDKDVRARIGMAKKAFLKNKVLQTKQIKIETRARLARCYVWSTALYGAESWTLKAGIKEKLASLERWIWRKMLGIKWSDKVSNDNLLRLTGESNWKLVDTIVERSSKWYNEAIGKGELIQQISEGTFQFKRARGRPKVGILNQI